MESNVTIDSESFMKLSLKKQNLVLFNNVSNINSELSKRVSIIEKKSEINRIIGFIWLFLVTVAIGLKKYLPF